jgi:hypothetical protein
VTFAIGGTSTTIGGSGSAAAGVGSRLAVPSSVIPAGYFGTFAWYRSTDGGGWQRIAGSGGAAHKVKAADAGRTVKCVVTMTKPGAKTIVLTFTRRIPKVASKVALKATMRRDGSRTKVTFKIAVTAPGVKSPTGKVKVKVGSKAKTVKLKAGKKGKATVTFGQVKRGSHKLRADYKGNTQVKKSKVRGDVSVS